MKISQFIERLRFWGWRGAISYIRGKARDCLRRLSFFANAIVHPMRPQRGVTIIGHLSSSMTLQEFLIDSVRRGNEGIYDVKPRNDVTVLMYFYWPSEIAGGKWPQFYGALLETWRHCGLLRTIVVTNERHACIADFAEEHENVEIQVENSLKPGSLKPMSIDCDMRLGERFDTDYVLIVQNDGFPLRRGLDEFVGKYDYIGAPWERHMTYYDWYPDRYRVGNGGFSLRSKRLCQEVSRLYRKWFRWMPYWWYLLGDDTFYCKTLRFLFPRYRRMFRWATKEEAARFSVESGCGTVLSSSLPFGFHGELGWKTLQN